MGEPASDTFWTLFGHLKYKLNIFLYSKKTNLLKVRINLQWCECCSNLQLDTINDKYNKIIIKYLYLML